MGALLESGLVGNIGLKHLKVIKEDTIGKWDKLGFLEGLKGHMRENVAQLYENQRLMVIDKSTGNYTIYDNEIGKTIFTLYARNIWGQHNPNQTPTPAK